MKHTVLSALAVLTSLYLLGAVVLYTVQERMLFPAPVIPADDLVEMATIAGVDALSVTSGEETLYGWHRQVSGTHVVLYFHGNASSAVASTLPMRAAEQAGWDFVCISPRGYPGSTGAPQPGFLAADAHAAWAYTTEVLGYSPGNIVLHGRSLGGGQAGTLMGEVAPAGIILESTFRSMAALVQQKVPVFPMGLILKYPLHTEKRAPKVQAPVLVLHGDADTMIPVAHGRALSGMFANVDYVEVAGKGHNDGLLRDATTAATLKAWLEQRR